MKELEKEYRTYLPKKSYAVIRVDGKGFSKYTKDLVKPFDYWFTECMRETALYLAKNVDGALFAYTQSDEISVVFSDLAGENTEWWFGGQVQKIVSIVAAMATAKFNSLRDGGALALFDARVHHLDGKDGVLEYARWRQEDAMKNSVGMLASHHFSHKRLMGVSTDKRVMMLALEKDVDWGLMAPALRLGSWVHKVPRKKSTTYVQNGEKKTVEFVRNEWVVEDAPRFVGVEELGLERVSE
jgi:tRNA(His) 5'-end guanylyltransferase